MRIKGHGVRICSNHPGAVPNLYILEKVRPVYHYSSKTHRRLAYLNWIILDSTCLFPTGIGTSDPSPQLNYKAQTELLIGHRSQMEQSGLSRNRAPKKSSIWSKCAKKKKESKYVVLLTYLTATLLLWNHKKYKDINSKSVLSELFYITVYF